MKLSYCLLLALVFPGFLVAQIHDFDGEKTAWHAGFDRYDYIMDENTLVVSSFKAPEGEGFGVKDPPVGQRRCIVVVPKHPAPGNPWSWRGCYWDHQPQTEVELLRRGFFVVYISANATLKPGKEWDAWYAWLTGKGLSAKAAFIGMSRGGEYEYMWATAHPDAVACIYADNPAIDREALMKLGGLAARDVPLLHICGSMDPLYAANTFAVEQIYRGFGGRVSVMIKEGYGHHPHSLRDPKPIADFIESSFRGPGVEAPAFVKAVYSGPGAAGGAAMIPRTWYYGYSDSYRWVAAENAYITTRGPFFSGCYARYQLQIPGVDAFSTVIVPAVVAPGNPWIFRADNVSAEDVVDQALLASGWTIVTGAVPYNYDGPVLAQWNTIYAYLTGQGFSGKVVMAGRGAAAGEAIAWAIVNADKVTCIYAENPILQTRLMTHAQPIDSLAPLAAAAVPMLFVCGAGEPSFGSQARLAAARYRALGGRVMVIVRKQEGHVLRPGDPAQAVAFITGKK
jgi:pimeloyl-ACP methyl ester carboxylesterase